jgi:WD40 repeat protein
MSISKWLVLTLTVMLGLLPPVFAQPDAPATAAGSTYTHRVLLVSPDGRYVAELLCRNTMVSGVMHYDPHGTRVRLWEIGTGLLKWEKYSPANVMPTGSFSPDGRRLLCHGMTIRQQGAEIVESKSTLRLWDIESGQRLDAIELEEAENLSQLLFMPDSQSLLGVTVVVPGFLMAVKQWDAQSGKLARTISDFPAPDETILWPGKGPFLATSAQGTAERQKEDNVINVLSLPDLKLLHSRSIGKEQLLALALSPDGKKLVYKLYTPPLNETYSDRSFLWDTQTDTVTALSAPDGANFGALSYEFSADGQLLIGSGLGSGEAGPATHVWTWNGLTGEFEQSLAFSTAIEAFLASPFQARSLPDGKSFVAASSEGKVEHRSLRDGSLIRSFEQ